MTAILHGIFIHDGELNKMYAFKNQNNLFVCSQKGKIITHYDLNDFSFMVSILLTFKSVHGYSALNVGRTFILDN